MSANSDFPQLRTLPPGMKFYPLYDKCPCCGCDLYELYESASDQANAKDVENNAGKAGIPACINSLQSRKPKFRRLSRFVHWVVHPLCYTPHYATKADHESFSGGVGGQESGSVKQYDKSAYDDENLVPRIEGKFRQRVFHFLCRLTGRG